MLKNMTEMLAVEKLEDLLKSENCCKCDQCREDMLALALNKLPPHYVSTDKGQLFAKTDELKRGNEFDIAKELIMAINIVRNHPRHEVEKDGNNK